MNLKAGLSTIGFHVALMGTTAAAVVVAAPAAHAVSLGSNLNTFGSVRFDSNSGFLNFRPDIAVSGAAPVFIGESTGTFETTGLIALIQDLNLSPAGGGVYTFTGLQTNFISFINVPPLFSGFNDVQFTLTNFALNLASEGNSERLFGSLEGFFTQDGRTIAGVGNFTTQTATGRFDPNVSSSYSLSITAVPTPALLPGLIGMGVAALRRKQEEETSEENA